MTASLWAVVEEKLGLQWSPEQIAGRLRGQGVVAVGETWIYHHAWSDRASGGTLFCHLCRRGKKRNRRGRDGAGQIWMLLYVSVRGQLPLRTVLHFGVETAQ